MHVCILLDVIHCCLCHDLLHLNVWTGGAKQLQEHGMCLTPLHSLTYN